MTTEFDNGPDPEEDLFANYVPPSEERLRQIHDSAFEEVTGGDPEKKQVLLSKLNFIAKNHLISRLREVFSAKSNPDNHSDSTS